MLNENTEDASAFVRACMQEGSVRRPGPAEPFAGSLSSEHVRAEASGWQTRAVQRLRRPATASLQYTPALARRALTLTLYHKAVCHLDRAANKECAAPPGASYDRTTVSSK